MRLRCLLQVHDELISKMPDDEVAATLPMLQHVMQDALLPAVLLSVPRQPLGRRLGRGVLMLN